jgi:hypothetical protein
MHSDRVDSRLIECPMLLNSLLFGRFEPRGWSSAVQEVVSGPSGREIRRLEGLNTILYFRGIFVPPTLHDHIPRNKPTIRCSFQDAKC